MIFDGHSDLLYDVARRRLAGEKRVLEHRHLADLERGGIEGLVLALWTAGEAQTFWREVPEAENPKDRLEIMLLAMQAELEECPWLWVVRTREEAETARASGARYAFLTIEGMEPIGADLTQLDRLAGLGVRMGMLTWNGEDQLATGAGGDPWTGLTPLGRQAVRRMERLGMVVDVSHLNDAGTREVLAMAEGPVVASHSNCRCLCDVRRNLTDEQLRAIRDTGGVVGVNVHHAFVHADRERQTVEMLARHAAHMAEVMGVEHVACGFDFCQYFGPGNEGAAGLEDCSRAGDFFVWLERLGMSARERQLIARENLLRVLA